jgi:hypothetical protein
MACGVMSPVLVGVCPQRAGSQQGSALMPRFGLKHRIPPRESPREPPQYGFFRFGSRSNRRVTPLFPPNVAEKRRICGCGDNLRAHLACGRFLRNTGESIKRHAWPLAGRVRVGCADCKPEWCGKPAAMRVFSLQAVTGVCPPRPVPVWRHPRFPLAT